MELLVPAIGLMGSATIQLLKAAFNEKKRAGRGRPPVAAVADAVRNPRCLLEAVRRADLELVTSLLELGADQHLDTGHRMKLRRMKGSGSIEVSGFTPLMCAVMMDNAEMARLLLRYGADIEAECCGPDGTLRTALVLGVLWDRLRAVHALLEEGADSASYRTDPRGLTLVAWSRSMGRRRMETMLRRYEDAAEYY